MRISPKQLLKKGCSLIASLLVRCHVIPRKVIIAMDGGICSQMHFFLVGYMLRLRGQDVRYDLRWFRESGMDLDNRFCRNFDLLELFPCIDFTEARPGLLTRIYHSCFFLHNDYFAKEGDPFKWLSIRGPKYVQGYFRDPEQMYSEYFRRVFHIQPHYLDADCREIMKHIDDTACNSDTCAVHVRRGDLAKFNKAYGEPAEISYFTEACMKVQEHAEKPLRFFIFSDEPKWCAENLLPALDGFSVETIASNGSDRGYCDLAIMSRCRHIITSQGSMGKYAALLRDKKNLDGLVVLPDTSCSTPWLQRFTNVTTIANSKTD